jgi:hypothetical protein
MVSAWSILNKVASRGDARFSDVVLVVCPNVTIKNRLRELQPTEGDASIYRTRDLVPAHLMPQLRKGRVLVKNWHEFERKGMSAGAKVQRNGVPETIRSTIKIGAKTTSGRAGRYMTERALELALIDGQMTVVEDRRPTKAEVVVEETRYVESDTALIRRRIFPWVVSDFGLTDAIESGLVKIPQLAVADPTGSPDPAYFNLWRWIMSKLTRAERGGRRANPKPEAVLKHAHIPAELLAEDWLRLLGKWAEDDEERPPVFILVCKNTKLAKVVYEWLAEGNAPAGVPPFDQPALRNADGHAYDPRRLQGRRRDRGRGSPIGPVGVDAVHT